MTDRATPEKDAGCPLGGPRCHEAICDCFVDLYPDDPQGLHPEALVVGGSDHNDAELARYLNAHPGASVVYDAADNAGEPS